MTQTTSCPAGFRARLRLQPDEELLVRLRALPRGSAERDAICEVLVARYEKLVRGCARQYYGSPEPAEDLMQAGYVGLLKAINNYDPQLGNSLPAYAAPCVSGEIRRHFRDKRWQVHVRRSAQELMLGLRKATEELSQRLGRQPENEELAGFLGVSGEELLEARQADLAFSACSLDAPLSDREGSALLGDLFGAEDAGVARAIDMAAVARHWGELPGREQDIIIMSFYGNLTQAEIGARLGISQMHVSRLLARALGHLRGRLLGLPVPPSGRAAPARPLRHHLDGEDRDVVPEFALGERGD